MFERKSLSRVGIILAALTAAGCVGTSDTASNYGPITTVEGYTTALANTSPYQRGTVHFAAGSFGLALQSFQQALQRDRKNVAALNAVAATYDRLGRYELARPYYGRALALKPESVQTLNNIGYSSLMQNSANRARRYLDAALKIDKDNAIVKENAAIARDMIAKQKKIIVEPAVDQSAAPPVGTQAQNRVWVETTSRKVQTLVTTSRTSIAKSSLLHPSITRVAKAKAAAEPVSKQANRPDGGTATGAPVIEPAVHYQDLRTAMTDRPAPSRSAGGTATGAPVIEPAVHYRDLQSAAIDRSGPSQPMPSAGAALAIQAPAESPVSASREIMVARFDSTHAAPPARREPAASVREATPRASGEIKLAAREADLPTGNPSDNITPTDMLTVAATVAATVTSDDRSTYRRTRYEVSNGAGRLRMATRIRYFLADQGINPYYITNAEHYSNYTSMIFYRTGYLTDASNLARQLPIPVELVEVESQKADVRLRVGGDLLNFDRDLIVLSRKDLS